MKLARLPQDPSALVDFFHEGLERLGGVCERSWYDRLQLVVEGAGARLWNSDGALYETELHFPPADDTNPRDAAREVFPGCPLTFRLAESLRSHPLPLERALILADAPGRPPATEVAEKRWHAQWPGVLRWRLDAPWVAAHHFTLLALVRCEVQAIDQHWSLHRLAISLPDGQLDDGLAAELDFTQACTGDPASVTWPVPDPAEWESLVCAGLEQELFGDLAAIRARQENYLRREVERIDTYFETYEVELTQRALRSGSGQTKLKVTERLAAARTEHSRRLQDQVHRHGIRVIPHLDTLLLLAEPAWKTTVSFVEQSRPRVVPALFVPRARRWIVESPPGSAQ